MTILKDTTEPTNDIEGLLDFLGENLALRTESVQMELRRLASALADGNGELQARYRQILNESWTWDYCITCGDTPAPRKSGFSECDDCRELVA